MAFIPQNDLSHELIKTILEEAAHEASLDDEGDVFISGDGIEFPVWVSLTRDRLVKIFTYAEMLDDVEFEDAVVFANDLNQSSSIRSFDWERLAKYSFWIFMIYAVIAIAAMTADKFLMELIEKICIDSKIIPCLIFAAVAVANVGQHSGKPVLFIINTPQMYKHGFGFYQAENSAANCLNIGQV